ncbi:MAG: hypothetical protein ACOCQH_02030 [Halanaerobiales bacterium]
MKKYVYSLLILINVFILMISVSVPAAAEQDGGDVTEETLIIRTGHLKQSGDKIEGTGGITMIKGDVNITGNRGIFFEEEEKAEISGDVLLEHDKGRIESQEMMGWIQQDRYIFEKNVSLIQQLDDGSFDLEAPYLELLTVDNSFQAREGVVIEYNERTLKGNEVDYNDNEQTLSLSGNVYIEEEDGDWVRSETAIFYLDTEEFNADGSVELEIKISSGDN